MTLMSSKSCEYDRIDRRFEYSNSCTTTNVQLGSELDIPISSNPVYTFTEDDEDEEINYSTVS